MGVHNKQKYVALYSIFAISLVTNVRALMRGMSGSCDLWRCINVFTVLID